VNNQDPSASGQTQDGAPESSAQLVSRVAHSSQERQESAQQAALREPPQFILDVEQSEVIYTLHPKHIPLPYIDFAKFAHALRERWGLSLDVRTLKVAPTVLQRLSADSQADEEVFQREVMRHVLQEREPSFGFHGGKYPLSKSEFVRILTVKLNFESVLVAVAGKSQVAEAIAQEVLELVNESAGADRPWSVLEQEVRLIGYATKTRVALGPSSAFERLLSPRFLTFLEGDVVDGERFGAHAGSYYVKNGEIQLPDLRVVYGLDDLVVRITSFDEATAGYKETHLRFSVTARSDHHSGIVSVSSELPYDIHEKFLGRLIDSLDGPEPDHL
jgi:hypothetical protein